ncbi:MAG: MBL fold metallo-hydrolase [Verrucomicrobiia bacterium]
MNSGVELVEEIGGARSLLAFTVKAGEVGLAWLGQAGFLLRTSCFCCLIDPYLSDYLARKYRGSEFNHARLQAPPILPKELDGIDMVLCSHRHGDHMDPESLPIIAARNASCKFLIPRAELDLALALGLPKAQIVPVNAGETIDALDSVSIRVFASAHETLHMGPTGEHRYLGFMVAASGLEFYHSGDSVVYDGLAQQLLAHSIDVALLPINGRTPTLTSHGILGNMTFKEAVGLCAAARIPLMIPHHFGMFAFNTCSPPSVEEQVASLNIGVRCIIPRVDVWYRFAKAPNPPSGVAAARTPQTHPKEMASWGEPPAGHTGVQDISPYLIVADSANSHALLTRLRSRSTAIA